MIDLSRVTKLRLRWRFNRTQPNPIRNGCLIDLFKQAPNIHSLTVDPTADQMIRSISGKDIHSTIMRYVHPSKLRYLEIPVLDIDQVQRLLNQFRNLSSIQFLLWIQSVSSRVISNYVETFMPDCSISSDSSSVRVWMSQPVEITNARKRRKVSHPRENV